MNRIDKIFKERLEHANLEVSNHQWESIARRLDQESKSKVVVWPYFMSAIVFIGLMGISMFLAPTSKSSKEAKIQNTRPAEQQISAFATLDKNIKGNQTSHIASTTIEKSKTYPPALAVPSNSQNSNSNNIFEQKASSIITTVNNPQNSTQIFAQNTDQDVIKGSLGDNNNGDAALNEMRSNIEVASLSVTKLPKVKSYRKFKINTKINKSVVVKACPFTVETNDKSIDAYISHDIVSSSFKTTPELGNVVAMRQQTESPMYSYSAGIRFGYNLSYRLNLHTGIQYGQTNTKFSYIDPESNQERLITIKDYIYENGKIVDSVITEEVVVVPGTKKIQVKNTFRSVDIPLIARITLLANRNLSLSSTVGTYFNISHNYHGQIIDTNLQPVNISKATYKTQLGLSAHVGLSLAYHIAADFDLVAEPYARIFFDDISAKKYPIAQRNNIFGLSTGVRYKF